MATTKTKKKLVKKHAEKKIPWYRKYPVIVFSTLILLLLILFVAINETQKNQDHRTRAQVTNCEVAASDQLVDNEERMMLDLINAYRQENNVPALSSSENLNRMAAWMSKDMSTKNYLDHKDSRDRTPNQRAAECGAPYGAENIATNTVSDATTIFNQWKASPSHNVNLLDPKYLYTGIARTGNYWVQDFAEDDNGAQPQPTISQEVSPTVNPTQPVPSPECLGSCPTAIPTVSAIPTGSISVTNAPEITPIDDIGTNPSREPSPIDDSENPGGGGDQGGFIELLLSFFRLLMEFFASLFN